MTDPTPVSDQLLQGFQERFECWNRGDLDEMQEMYAEDAIFDASGLFPGVPPMRGHSEMRRYWEELYESLEGLRMDPIEVFHVGGPRYIAHVRLWGRGQRSGVEVDQRSAALYEFRPGDAWPGDAKVAHARLFADLESALAFAGHAASRA